MKRVLILYHSGVGNTKMVAKKMEKSLAHRVVVDCYSIEHLPITFHMEEYDALMLGCPTIHTHPTRRMESFIIKINPLTRSMPTFLFTTCGLYSANTLRILAKLCAQKKMITIASGSYRCAATDGVLLIPKVHFFFTNEKHLDEKVKSNVLAFVAALTNLEPMLKLPRFKLYSILNYPNKWMGKHFPMHIYVHQDACTKCGRCIRQCPIGAIKKTEDGYPVINQKSCEHCYRCIHHCLSLAISLKKKQRVSKVLDHNETSL